MFQRLRRLFRIPVKLGFIVALLMVPLAVLVYQLISTSNVSINFARRELIGVDFLPAAKRLYQVLPQHRGTANGVLSGDETQADALRTRQQEVDTALTALEQTDQRLGDTLGTRDMVRGVRAGWEELKGKVNNRSVPPPEAFERHTSLITQVNSLIRRVGDASNLILDPDLDSYYLMDAVIQRLPDVTESLGQLRGLGNGIAARGQITQPERIRLTTLDVASRSTLQELQRGMAVAFQTNPELGRQLSAPLNAAATGPESFFELVERRLVGSETIDIRPAEYFRTGTEAIDRLFGLYDTVLVNLESTLQARIRRLTAERNQRLLFAGLAALAALAAALWVGRGITRQVGAITQVLARLGIGDFDARAKIITEDELGRTALYLNSMLDNTRGLMQSQSERDAIQAAIRKLLDEVSAVADGDLRVSAEVTADVTGAIADSFNFMIEELRRIISDVQRTTLTVSTSASDVQTTAELLARGSEAQASRIVSTSAAIVEMANSIQQVSKTAATASSVADQALTSARRGAESVRSTISGMNSIRQQVQETSKRIKRLGEGSQEIGEIIQLISDIADRTSILALNASIQAASAGEAGRGFAVVAEEIERLAERAADATKSIGTLIKTIQSETVEAVSAMEVTTQEVVSGSQLALTAGDALAEIDGVSTQLATLMQTISTAASRQAEGSEDVAKIMTVISEGTQESAEGSRRAANAIRNLADLADRLRASVSRFKLPAQVA